MIKTQQKTSSNHTFSVFFNQQTLQWMLIGNVYNMTVLSDKKINNKLYKITLPFSAIS